MKLPASGNLRLKNRPAAKSQRGARATLPLTVAGPESETMLVLRVHRAAKISRCHSTVQAVEGGFRFVTGIDSQQEVGITCLQKLEWEIPQKAPGKGDR